MNTNHETQDKNMEAEVFKEVEKDSLKVAVLIEFNRQEKTKNRSLLLALKKTLPVRSLCRIIRQHLKLDPSFSFTIIYGTKIVKMTDTIGAFPKTNGNRWIKFTCNEIDSFGC